jgi:hypothetical protein
MSGTLGTTSPKNQTFNQNKIHSRKWEENTNLKITLRVNARK